MTDRDHFVLDPGITFLNHGSYGACPRAVLGEQARLRERLEREPVRFFQRELPGLLAEARAALARFVRVEADDLAFVHNATTGVNAVVRSLALSPGDEILTTDHAYAACRNALDYVASATGARVVTARVPFPLAGDDDVALPMLAAVTARTRLALVDHVTSPTGLVFPVARVCAELAARGVDTLVDGAHAPGMLDLDVPATGAAYYTGNCHKWLCAPKGAGFLWVRRDRQEGVHPVTISHGYAGHAPRTRFLEEFDWVGTDDPTPWLCVPAAIREIGGLRAGGWPEVRAANHALVVQARTLLCDALGIAPPAPEAMLGSLASVPLPALPPEAIEHGDPLQERLFAQGFEVPVMPWPSWGQRLLRVSAQVYNHFDEYRRLARAMMEPG